MVMTDEYKKRAQALTKKIQVVAFIVAAIMVAVVVFSSIL
jgi:cell division protein FtsX